MSVEFVSLPCSLTSFQIFGTFVSLVFLGQAFTIMLVYVWSRRNPNVRMNFFGLLNFQAPFLPWVLMGFSLLLGNSIIVDLLGSYHCHVQSLLSALVMCSELKRCGWRCTVWIVLVLKCFFTFLEVSLLVMCTTFWRTFSPTSQVVGGGSRPHLSCEYLVSSDIFCWIKQYWKPKSIEWKNRNECFTCMGAQSVTWDYPLGSMNGSVNLRVVYLLDCHVSLCKFDICPYGGARGSCVMFRFDWLQKGEQF